MAWTDKYVIAGGLGAADGSSEANAWDWPAAITHSTTNTHIQYNCKASTKNMAGTSLSFSGSGTTSAPNRWRGYKTTPGDLDTQPATARTSGTDFPLITFTSGSVTIGGNFQDFENIEFRGTAPGTRLVGVTGASCKFLRCRFDCQEASATSYTMRLSGDGCNFVDCWFKGTSTASHVVFLEGVRSTVSDCQFLGGGNGLYVDATGGIETAIIGCIFDDNGSDGIKIDGSASRGAVISGCTFYSPGGNGIDITTAVPTFLLIRNCLFHTVTAGSTFAVKMPSGTAQPLICGCAYYNVTSRFSNVTESLEYYPVTESSDPLPNAASHDFTLTSGALSIGGGMPGLFEGP